MLRGWVRRLVRISPRNGSVIPARRNRAAAHTGIGGVYRVLQARQTRSLA
jgi:hypothetical protein